MAFEKKVPEWLAEGTEPPQSLKKSGFQAGYKPPAAYFNWFWAGMSAAVKELQEGAAPSGYGLGEAQYFTADELDNLTRPGFYYTENQMTIGGFPSTRWWMEVAAYGAGASFATQCMYTFYSGKGYALERSKVNEAWEEWGWVNPPMTLGVEYRTTERIAGKAVYKKNEGGTILYRLDGETQWKSFAELIGNNPGGSYTGNGSATQRTVAVGGIGDVLSITSDVGMVLVSSRGAICLDRQTGEISGLKSWEAYCKEGVFTIATNSDHVNKSGQTYWYSIL